MDQTYAANLAPSAGVVAAHICGPVGDVIRMGISAQPLSSSHDHSHDHGGYEHYCEK
jgi:hypothetical protein